MSTLLTSKGTQATTTEPVTSANRGPLREAAHRIHLTIQDMNYAARRVVELQAGSNVDQQRKSK